MLKSFKRLMRSNTLFTIGILICLFWILVSLFAPLIAPYDPIEQSMANRLQAPSTLHLFGTDAYGRDILSRILYGGRLSVFIGVFTVILTTIFGSLYGAAAGFAGGIVDDILMRISEVIRSFPSIVLAIVISASFGPSLVHTILALVIVSWPSYARLMRGAVIAVKENEYVEAARALGASPARILFKEILVNAMSPVLVNAATDVGAEILMFSTLSFLGLGAAPPTPEWGLMISDGVANFTKYWITLFPGLAIFTMAMGANFVGDGIRDLLDPRIRKLAE